MSTTTISTPITIPSSPSSPLLERAPSSTNCCNPSCAQIINAVVTAATAVFATLVGAADHTNTMHHPRRDALILAGLGAASLGTITTVFKQHNKENGVCKSVALTARDTLVGAAVTTMVVASCVLLPS